MELDGGLTGAFEAQVEGAHGLGRAHGGSLFANAEGAGEKRESNRCKTVHPPHCRLTIVGVSPV